jgi:hypothetical protein
MFAVSAAIAILCPLVSMNENQTLYLYSTSSQVIAGIYGLTLTGFIFLRNELSREEAADDTLEDAVEALKSRYFIILLFITVFVMASIGLSNLAIVSRDNFGEISIIIILNAAQSAFATSILSIAYFIFDVTSPKRIERASRVVQGKNDPTLNDGRIGKLEDFVRNFNAIEQLLLKYGMHYQQVSSAEFEKMRRLPNSRLAEILQRNERINSELFERLRRLISLRNSIIHGAEPIVSPEMVEESASVLSWLKSSLDR